MQSNCGCLYKHFHHGNILTIKEFKRFNLKAVPVIYLGPILNALHL